MRRENPITVATSNLEGAERTAVGVPFSIPCLLNAGCPKPAVDRRVISDPQHINSVLLEPRQELLTSSEALIAFAFEVRRQNGATDSIVDVGYPEVPQLGSLEHRLFHMHARNLRRIEKGGRLLGGTCLEYDVISASSDCSCCHVGDTIFIADVGAYDAGMAFKFAQGERL